MTSWIIGSLAVYLVLILLIGFFSGRGSSQSSEAFFVANRKLTWIQEGMAIFTSAVPAAALTGTIGLFYKNGASMLGYMVAYLIVTPAGYWLIGSRLRRIGEKFKYQTQADFVGEFFGSKLLHYIVALGGLLFLVPYFAVNPVAMGLILNQFTGLPYTWGVAIFLLVTLAYSFFGGLRAIADTDVFHGVLLIVFFIITIIAVVVKSGGYHIVLGSPLAVVPMSTSSITTYLTWVAYLGLHPMMQPDRCLRMYSVADDRNIRKGAILTAATLGFASAGFFLIGVSGRILAPNVPNTDTALASTLAVAAVWLIPFYIVNLWGGGMSGLSSGLLGTANIFTKDFYMRWKRKYANLSSLSTQYDRTSVRVARIFMVVVTVIAAIIAGKQPIFLWTLINITNSFFIQLVPVFFGGLYWSRATRRGAEISLIVGVLLTAYWTFFTKPPFGFQSGLAALIVNAALFVIASLLTKNTEQELTRRGVFVEIATTPVEEVL